jgi:cation/acetate symporter
MIIVLFYATLGGMKGITYTQVACIVNICFHGSCYLYFYQMTGNPVPQLGMGGQVLGSDTYLLDKLNGLSTDLGFSVYTNGTKSMVDVFAITLALMVGTAGLP